MNSTILVFELNNSQESFASLMQIVNLLETNGGENELFDVDLNKFISIKYCWLKDESIYNFRSNQIVQGIEKQRMNNKINGLWKLHNLSNIEQVIKEKNKYEIGYYVCVKTTDECDVKNIQYLVLLLQQFKSICDKIFVFLEPYEGYYNSPNQSFSLYYKYSHYLRFITRNYKKIFFSAFCKKGSNIINIAPLSCKKQGIQSTFFPLLEINNNTHTLLSHYCFLDENGLLNKNENNVNGYFVDLVDIIEISQKMLESNISKKIKIKKELTKIKNKIYNELINQGITCLEYVVFATLLSNIDIVEEEVLNSLQRAKSIASGLIQLIENVVLHSTNHVGIFSLRVITEGKKYKGEIMEESKDSFPSDVLEIDICDTNIKESIVDNFLKKIPDVQKFFGKIEPAVPHFFGKYKNNEEEEAWAEFRRHYPVKCLGLQRLNLELKLCGALLLARSNKYFKDCCDGLFYKANYYNHIDFFDDDNYYHIPGTQFQIVIPMFSIKNDGLNNANLYLDGIGNIKEDDKTYASFVDLNTEKVDLKTLANAMDSSVSISNSLEDIESWLYKKVKVDRDANPKDELVELWRNLFDVWGTSIGVGNEKIYYLNMQGVSELKWGSEPFCKGLISSSALQNENLKYLVLINCENNLINMFFDTIILSNKKLYDNLQIFLHSKNGLDDLLITGKDREDIERNAIQYTYFKGNISKRLYNNNDWLSALRNKEREVYLLPYDVFINQLDNEKTLFEDYIEKVADNYLTSMDKAGYLLDDSHMRLGNKVHLEKFYEISILFRKHRVARKVAMLVLKDMLKNGIDLKRDIVFYGYASYSRAILVALVEITREYKKKKNIKEGSVEFAVYQNDMQIQKSLIDINPKARMYYGRELPIESSLDIIQIVPISSTLTTFKKMWDVFPKKAGDNLKKNYTLFWVRDISLNYEMPTEIEKKYWTKIEDKNYVKTDLISPSPRFFCCKTVKWHHPLNCECCYPKNIIDERALVETDVTSTVPSQQLEINLDQALSADRGMEEKQNENRLIELEDCVYYGHICRDNNHFQYYIDTNMYFNKQKGAIVDWLKMLKADSEEMLNEEKMIDVLNIIITPQHHTNVEFCHYVNNYFFNGNAEIITVDSAKEYRSNMIAKYADVKQAISLAKTLHTKVILSYVDDTIITGNTFHRVNNLIHSLIPKDDVLPLQFDKVFVLINRLSNGSKMAYVRNPQRDFMAFAEINVSSIRNFGDSCTMCTLEKNSRLFSHRASTISLSRYWKNKEFLYRSVSFDKYVKKENKLKDGYIRLLCSHYAKSSLHMSRDKKISIFEITNLMLDLKEENREKNKNMSLIYQEVFTRNKKCVLKAFLKVLCRPFFAYGKIYRQVVLDLFLMIAQCFIMPEFYNQLGDCENSSISQKKNYLNDYVVRAKICELYDFILQIIPQDEMVEFILDYVLEGLADLRSNYLIRYETIKNMRNIIQKSDDEKKYFEKYEQQIYRIVNGSADETKSLWLEKMLYTQIENDSYMEDDCDIQVEVYTKDNEFSSFWDSLFINNTRLYYDSMLNFLDKAKEENIINYSSKIIDSRIETAVNDLWDDYYIQNLRKFIKLEIQAENTEEKSEKLDPLIKERIIKSAKLLFLLKTRTANGIERYTELKDFMQNLLYPGDKLFIFTKSIGEDDYCSVTDYKNGNISQMILKHIRLAIESPQLASRGFYVGDGYIVICIDSDYQYLKKNIEVRNVESQPLYFYIKCETKNTIRVNLRIRYLLMYRHQIIKWIDADFNNNALPIISTQTLTNRQLLRDKAGDHSSRQDIAVNHRLLQSVLMNDVITQNNYNPKLYIWLLFRAYVNMRIARLFRSEWSESSRDKVYTKKEDADKMNGPLINLAESFFGKRLGDLSPRRYFEFISCVFQFDICINQENREDVSIDELQKFFEKLEGRQSGDYFYKEEFIICIVFDIMFSAMKNCMNWEIGCCEFFEKKMFEDVFTDTDVCVAYYFGLLEMGKKCRIHISIENSNDMDVRYLVFKNRVHKINDVDSLIQINEEFQNKLQMKETIGLSIQTIQWYTETLDVNRNVKAEFSYVWNEKEDEAEFVTKLPILKGGKE